MCIRDRPDNRYLYCFDNAGFPYSEKSEETIIQRTLDICKKINQDYPLDAIVIACNTAVSYTHLDVYKRQVKHGSSDCARCSRKNW